MTKREDLEEDGGLERLLSECFAGGEYLRRELRLTRVQAQHLAERYPTHVRDLGESWYEITFQGAYFYGN